MTLLEAIQQKVLLGDGAMGTQLQAAGLEPGGCGEIWNIERPDVILAIEKAYVEAGSDVLISNTFGASRIMLARHGYESKVREINRAGVRIAREAFGDKQGFVLGDIGPFGGLMEPHGEVPESTVREAFDEQAQALVDAGADAIIIETMTALEELGIAIEAARKAGAPLIIGSVAFDVTTNGKDVRTMMGISPEKAAKFLEENGAHIAALNCGAGVDMVWAARIAARYREACSLPVMAQPNAGLPVLEKMKVVYKQDPDEFAAGVPALIESGVRIIGACCGSTPLNIRKFREILPAL
ncbi:MAG: homocysteine S-methyltransferase family protein [Bryobacterales bacterium]|nr:homocysteine S-methyltransferase family protein [Bryobacterales bacterium]